MAFKTKISFARLATEEEIIDRQARLDEAIANGTTDGTFEQDGNFKIRPWTTREAAQAWIDYAYTIVPGPAKAEIIEE